MKYTIDDLQYLMARLRDPDTGCPWDIAQTFESIVPSTIEEAYEVADAIGRGAFDEVTDELGDLLFQVIFYSQMGKEQSTFDFTDVVDGIVNKLIRRHPHVFPDGSLSSKRSAGAPDEAAIKASWEQIKSEERALRGDVGVLDSVPTGLPGLIRAQKLGKRASNVGFDWSTASQVMAKVHEELAELEQALSANDADNINEEIGDVLFSIAQLGRHLGINVEQSIQASNQKFTARFKLMEDIANDDLGNITEHNLEALWLQAKERLKLE